MEQFPNMITHIVDFLFVYDFEDDSKNKVFKRQIIEPKNETSEKSQIIKSSTSSWRKHQSDLDAMLKEAGL